VLYLFGLGDKSELLFGQVLRRSLLVLALVLVDLNLVGRREVVAVRRPSVRHAVRPSTRTEHALFTADTAGPGTQTADPTLPTTADAFRSFFVSTASTYQREHATERAALLAPSLLLFGFLNARPSQWRPSFAGALTGLAAARHSPAASARFR